MAHNPPSDVLVNHPTAEPNQQSNPADTVWQRIRSEACKAAEAEPAMSSFIYNTLLRHATFETSLTHLLAGRLGNEAFPSLTLLDILYEAFTADPTIGESARADVVAVHDRDAAVDQYLTPYLYQKGFHALQAYRCSRWLCDQGRFQTALYLQSRIAESFSVDIHPCAKIGKGVMIDHAHAIVIGETAVVGDNVSMLHEVTLGGTGKERGDRHPKIGNNVLIGAGAKILGNINVGANARIGAGSVVLDDVPSGCTAVGVPAKLVKCPDKQPEECWGMDHMITKKDDI